MLSSVVTSFSDWFIEESVTGLLDEGLPFWEAHQKAINDPCATSPTGHHDFTLQASVLSPKIRTETCRYCDVTWSSFYLEAEDAYVSTLDRTEATSHPSEFADIHFGVSISEAYTQGTLANYATVSSISDNTVTVLGIATNSSTSATSSLYVKIAPFTWNHLSGTYSFYYSFFPWDLYYYLKYYGSYVRYSAYLYCVDTSTNTTLFDSYHSVIDDTSTPMVNSYSMRLTNGYTYYLYFLLNPGESYLYTKYKDFVMDDIYVSNVYVGNSGITQPGTSTRISSLMQIFNQYNIDNSYTENSTNVNFFLVPTGEEPSEDTAVSPAIYDEETLVFTEPATGAQYQTTGWTYDYTTRTYDITLDAGTFSLDGTDVTRIVSTYGDELASITYYDASGNALATDEYNYVMMSGSACSIDGHSYTYETVKEATCFSMGERKYTCSVCGDEYAEDIPTTGHAYGYSIYQEPTCTAAGIGLYTCPTCGDQYTEPIEPNGHVSELIQYVPTEYDENGIVVTPGYSVYSCSVCGSEYTVADEIPLEDEGWFDFMSDLLKSFLKTIITTLAAGLSKLFSAMADLISWIFGFLTETVLSGIKGFFDSFSNDSSIFDGFRQENEDGSTTVGLPSGVATAFQFFSGTILLLPDDLRLVLVFGIAALFVIAVFNKRP